MKTKGLAVGLLCLVCSYALAAEGWWNKEWRYRLPVSIDSGMFERTDYLVRTPLDLKKLDADAKMAQGVDLNSLRVVELDADTGATKEVPCVFKKNKDFFPGVKEEGTLIWQMAGNTPTLTQRYYHVYFDAKGSGKTAPAYAAIPGADEAVGENLIPNGSFEKTDPATKLPIGWSAINITKATVGSGEVTQKEAHSGKNSIHISKPTMEGNSYMFALGGWRSPVKVKPGRKYRFSAWIKAEGKGTQCTQVSLQGANWQPMKTNVYIMPGADGTHDWKKVSGVISVPEDGVYARPQMHLFKMQGDAYYDDFELVEIPTDQPPTMTAGPVETAK